MRDETLKTIYNIIEHTNDHINDILEHHCICKAETRHALMDHIDNLHDSICMLEKLGEEDSTTGDGGIKNTGPIEKPMIVKKV